MKTKWSANWKCSLQPRKQRKYRYEAPLHVRGAFLNVHLSKELRHKHGKRAVRVRKGDKVKIVRGSFKGQSGKVERVDLKKNKIYIAKVEIIKKDGTKRSSPIEPSNVLIQELNLEDKRRFKRGAKKTTQKSEGKKEKPKKEVAKIKEKTKEEKDEPKPTAQREHIPTGEATLKGSGR